MRYFILLICFNCFGGTYNYSEELANDASTLDEDAYWAKQAKEEYNHTSYIDGFADGMDASEEIEDELDAEIEDANGIVVYEY